MPSCPIRDQLEAQVYAAIQILAQHSARHSSMLDDLTVTPDEFIETTRLCEEARLLIQELERQIASHRAEHGC